MNHSGPDGVEVVEILLGDESDAVEDGAVIDHSGTARWRPILLGMLVLLLAIAAWQVLGDGPEGSGDGLADSGAVDIAEEVEPSSPTEPATTEAPPTTGPLRTTPAPAEETDEESEAVGGVADEVAVDELVLTETFPLFPRSPGLTLAIQTNDEVVLLDADTGAVGRISTAQGSPQHGFGPFGNTMALVGDSLAVQDGSGVVLYPLDGGGSIDLGTANGTPGAGGISVQKDRLIVVSIAEFPSFRQFDESGNEIGELLTLRHPNAFPDPFGHIDAPGGVYEIGPDGFRRISRDTLVASGANHLLTVACDESLACGHNLTDIEAGSSQEVLLDDDFTQFISPWSATLSPSGRYLQYLDHRKAGRLIVDLVSGDIIDAGVINSQSNGPPPRIWTPDSKYLVESFRSDSILIAESATGDVRTIDLEPFGIDGILSVPLVFERP